MDHCFEKYIKDDNLTFKYAKGASVMKGKEFHPYYEILYFMGNEAEFISEGIHTLLSGEKLIVIPKEFYHQLIVKGNPQEYLRCIFNFYEIPELDIFIKNNIKTVCIKEVSNQIRFLFGKMTGIVETSLPKQAQKEIMRSVFTLLLTEISGTETENISFSTSSALVTDAIKFISENIFFDISVGKIAQMLNVSSSHLVHSFKKEMNISIYRYIIKRRLIHAHRLISAGENATKASLECGFNDYSGFYKQYKKMFGYPPSEKKRITGF